MAVLRRAGILRFVVVLGFEAQRVREEFEKIAARRGCEMTFVVAPDWKKGNGMSVAAAEAVVADSPFLLTMVDHLLSTESVERLIASPPSPGHIKLAADFAKASIFDPDDATKVAVADGRLTAIGNSLCTYDAVDTGLFYCTPVLFSGIHRAVAKGRYSLTDGVIECARDRRVEIVDVTGEPWIDVDTPEARTEAAHRIEASLGKSHEDGFASRFLNRPLSRRLSRWLLGTGITPNQISVISFSLVLMGALALAIRDNVSWMAAGLLIHLGSVVDGCDGELARAKLLDTPRGAWLDTILDRYADIAIAGSITFAAFRGDPAPFIWICDLLAVTGFLLASYVTKEYELRFGRAFPDTSLNRLKRRDLRLLVLALGALLGHPFAALVAVGVWNHAVILVLMVTTWRRESRPAGRTVWVFEQQAPVAALHRLAAPSSTKMA